MVLSRSGPSVVMMRPKPPSWRDFETPSANAKPATTPHHAPAVPAAAGKTRRTTESHLGFRTLSLAQRSSSEGTDLSRLGLTLTGSYLTENRAATLPHASNSKRQKKQKNLLHRTRSQQGIDKADLPKADELTLRLADTKPSDLGVGAKRDVDIRIYFDENTRRCEQWLAGVHASHSANFPSLSAAPPVTNLDIPEEQSSDLDSAVGVTAKTQPGRDRRHVTAALTLASGSEEHIDSVSVAELCLDKSGVKEAQDSTSITQAGSALNCKERTSEVCHTSEPDELRVEKQHGTATETSGTHNIPYSQSAEANKSAQSPVECSSVTDRQVQSQNELNRQQKEPRDSPLVHKGNTLIDYSQSQSNHCRNSDPLPSPTPPPDPNQRLEDRTHSRETSHRMDTGLGTISPLSSSVSSSNTRSNKTDSLECNLPQYANSSPADKKLSHLAAKAGNTSSHIMCQTKL